MIRPDNVAEHTKLMQRCEQYLLKIVKNVKLFFISLVNVGEDCPVFDGMYEFCQLSAGGSIGKLHDAPFLTP